MQKKDFIAIGAAFGVSIVFTILTKVIFGSFNTPEKVTQQAPKAIEKVPEKSNDVLVLLASMDVSPGTAITSSNTEWKSWPRIALQNSFCAKEINDNSFINKNFTEQQIFGMYARYIITRGMPIVSEGITREHYGGLVSALLKSNMQAVTFPLNTDWFAGSLVYPGDIVDVFINDFDKKIRMKNVRVLAIDNSIDKTSNFSLGASKSPRTITLEIPTKHVNFMISAAKDKGIIISVSNIQSISSSNITPEIEITQNKVPVQQAIKANTVVASKNENVVKPSEDEPVKVRVIKGSQVSSETVNRDGLIEKSNDFWSSK